MLDSSPLATVDKGAIDDPLGDGEPQARVEFPSSRLTDMYMLGCTEHPFDMAENVLSKCLDL